MLGFAWQSDGERCVGQLRLMYVPATLVRGGVSGRSIHESAESWAQRDAADAQGKPPTSGLIFLVQHHLLEVATECGEHLKQYGSGKHRGLVAVQFQAAEAANRFEARLKAASSMYRRSDDFPPGFRAKDIFDAFSISERAGLCLPARSRSTLHGE